MTPVAQIKDVWKMKLGVQVLFGKVAEISPTKRNILKVIASVYNPIRVIQPIVIKLKPLFQEICWLNIDWDDDISPLTRCHWSAVESIL